MVTMMVHESKWVAERCEMGSPEGLWDKGKSAKEKWTRKAGECSWRLRYLK